MSRILVVGGAGYVGCVLVEELLAKGYSVRVFDRMYYGDYGLRGVRDRIELVVGDMRRMGREVLDGVDGVIHLAGLSNDPTAEYNPAANHEMNTVATYQLAQECAKRHCIRRFVFASTASIYDQPQGVADVVYDEDAVVEPSAAYSSSKYSAEKALWAVASEHPAFYPVILRCGTICGWSPRMRYDLVVNAFVRDALVSGCITIYYGGEMWRPIVDVRDVARAYVACLQVDENMIRNQVFNVVAHNYRISELALRAARALSASGIQAEINADYSYRGVRSYRISGEKAWRVLGFRPVVTVEESVATMVDKLRADEPDYCDPRGYNIRWMKLLDEAQGVIAVTGSVFGAGPQGQADE